MSTVFSQVSEPDIQRIEDIRKGRGHRAADTGRAFDLLDDGVVYIILHTARHELLPILRVIRTLLDGI